MNSNWKKKQRGVTILLVAITLFVVLAMAALAIDITSLYVARSEAQRAADAAALAAAKAFVISGYTSDTSGGSLQTVATTLAQHQINAVLQQNSIAGHPGSLRQPPTFSVGNASNPQVTVVVQQTSLPIFFSRIWSRAHNSVSATATAEAFNPSGTTVSPPSSAQCIKPFIVPNLDPGHAPDPFVDVVTGALKHPGAFSGGGIVGEPITLSADCPTGLPGCPNTDNPPVVNGAGALEFVPAVLPAAPSKPCPSCSGGGSDFENNIGCCNNVAMACNSSTQVALGGTAPTADLLTNPKGGGGLKNGLQCLLHQPPGSGEDAIDTTKTPFLITAGSGNPLLSAPNPVVTSGSAISTSDSIITLLIYDGAVIPGTGQVNTIGYMQVFVVQENGGNGTFNAVILNIAGCGNTGVTTAPIFGGGTSAIPVRLIHL